MCRDITDCIYELHSKNIAHEHITIENFFYIDSDLYLNDITPLSDTLNNNIIYLSPEEYMGEKIDPIKVDMWRIGIIMYYMKYDTFPFQNYDELDKYIDDQNTLKNNSRNNNMQQFIMGLLEVDTNKRLTSKEMFENLSSRKNLLEHKPLSSSINYRYFEIKDDFYANNTPNIVYIYYIQYKCNYFNCGCFSASYIANVDGKNTVIKVFKSFRSEKKTIDEFKKISNLKNKYIVEYINEFITSNKETCLLTNYYENGNLQILLNYYINNNEKLNENLIKTFTLSLLNGFAYLHSLNINHGNLKPTKILISENKKELLINEYGLLGIIKYYECLHYPSSCYLSPEVMFSKKITNKSDIWSLGCILYQIATLELFFDGKDARNLLHIDKKINIELDWLNEIINKMICLKPENRENINNIINILDEKDIKMDSL